MKFLSYLAAAGVALTLSAAPSFASDSLAGAALQKKLTNTQMTLRPVGKQRKGAPTRYVVKLLPTGEAVWQVNGEFKRNSHFHWRIRGNLLCFDGPNRAFRDERRRARGQEVRKRDKLAGCSPLGLQGDRATLYPPVSQNGRGLVLTGRIKSIWP